MTAADMVADLRAAGMSNDRIARILGVSPQAVSYWQRGDRRPGSYCRTRLAALHAHLDGWAVVSTPGGAAA